MEDNNNNNNQNKKTGRNILIGSCLLGAGLMIGGTITLGATAIHNIKNSIKTISATELDGGVTPSDISSGEPTDLPPYIPETTTQATTSAPAQVQTYTQQIQTPPTTQNNNNFIGLAKAQQIALNKTGGGTIVSSKEDLYDDDCHDIPKYEFKILNNNTYYELDINAINGDVMEFEIDD